MPATASARRSASAGSAVKRGHLDAGRDRLVVATSWGGPESGCFDESEQPEGRRPTAATRATALTLPVFVMFVVSYLGTRTACGSSVSVFA